MTKTDEASYYQSERQRARRAEYLEQRRTTKLVLLVIDIALGRLGLTPLQAAYVKSMWARSDDEARLETVNADEAEAVGADTKQAEGAIGGAVKRAKAASVPVIVRERRGGANDPSRYNFEALEVLMTEVYAKPPRSLSKRVALVEAVFDRYSADWRAAAAEPHNPAPTAPTARRSAGRVVAGVRSALRAIRDGRAQFDAAAVRAALIDAGVVEELTDLVNEVNAAVAVATVATAA